MRAKPRLKSWCHTIVLDGAESWRAPGTPARESEAMKPEAQAEPAIPVAEARRDGRGIDTGIMVFGSF